MPKAEIVKKRRSVSRPSTIDESKIDLLRDGDLLDKGGISAILAAINLRFEEISELWGGVIHFSVGSVLLKEDIKSPESGERSKRTEIAFRKHGNKWGFLISISDPADESGESLQDIPIASASIRQRLLAVESLPRLRENLEMNNAKQRDRLLDAYDLITRIMHEEST